MKLNPKTLLAMGIVLIILAGLVGFVLGSQLQDDRGEFPLPHPNDDQGVACTMEAKVCPDGSYVGRQAPNCEFAPCPGL